MLYANQFSVPRAGTFDILLSMNNKSVNQGKDSHMIIKHLSVPSGGVLTRVLNGWGCVAGPSQT